ncbi:MAG: hypothetical protein RID15_05220 [Marinovum algicola]|jgi:hypothetical protein|uniref:Uncharacterized protein n=1 Tax=Marinovum algicola TaxID=42444 RepID=A0A975W8M8_9RHOB|nr:hypothetical protein [Marinovum algicola]SEJ12603.1 hypothetical protein SAMN04487940_103291 [Marinovum algicola]SLN21412.1 hypothetical protein MAA5396_00804 [Marinovum algicola]
MDWNDISTNWTDSFKRLKSRFPRIDEQKLGDEPVRRDVLAAHLAHQHDLTELEAEEELRDWAYVQSLARQASELEAG